jgi:3-oxoacyl-[acyl-carrier protein] reductase
MRGRKLEKRVPKSAVITGGSQGIGRAVATALVEQGTNVVFSARTSERVSALVDQLTGSGPGQVIGVPGDVSNVDDVERLVSSCAEEFGTPEALVTAAGLLTKGRLVDVTDDEIAATFQVNVMGTIYAARSVVPDMVANGYGRIVTISSVLAQAGVTHRTVYAASKAAIAQFSRGLATELAGTGVTVNSVAPGPIGKDQPGQAPDPNIDPAPAIMVDRETLLQRMGTPEDVARVVLTVLNDPTGFITGSFWPVDGGYTAH